ncbi:MAG: molybdopterin-dependent oxidoreductase [Coriobacteriaceae bacterium]
MSGHALTRRSFLVGSAGVAAVAAGAGLVSLSVRGEADADAETDKRTEVVHSLCNSCSSKCGYYAYVVDGELTKLIGDEAHPNAQGKLCARGYGYSQIAYSPDRLTDPMKKNENGEFEVIGWDQALSEIGQKVNDIIAQYGPEALAMVQDPRPSGKYYTKRFMNALGSPNVYTHGAACNLSKESGFTQAIGAANFESDVANSKMTMFIGRSYADAIRPSSVAALQQAHENGAHIVLVDPRLNNSIAFADEWVPINPGTDLALILAMSNVLINRDLYDAEYVAANSVGFDEWASAIAGYTPEWAEGITGIPAADIERLALEFAEAAPAASIEPSWRGAFGCSYANSGETARALCLFNTLLGCWNQPGGALFLPSVKAGDLDPAKFPEVPKVEAKMWGAEEYPLALSSMGTNLYVAEMAKEGNVKGLFFYNSNMAAGYSNPAQLAEDFANLDLMVVVDVQMSETAMLADYVLPECSYLERRELPEFVGGRVPVVSLRDQVLEVIHPNTRPADVIFTQLAEACGVGQYFPFTVDELADAQLRSVGTSLDELRQVGTISFPEKAYAYGKVPEWKAPTGKIQFTSGRAGSWAVRVPGESSPGDAERDRRRVPPHRQQAIHTHTQTANCEPLMDITKSYGLDRIWINAEVAERWASRTATRSFCRTRPRAPSGEGDRAHQPAAIYMPSHYGCKSRSAHGLRRGLNFMDFVPFHMEPAYGSAMTQETLVSVQKVGE